MKGGKSRRRETSEAINGSILWHMVVWYEIKKRKLINWLNFKIRQKEYQYNMSHHRGNRNESPDKQDFKKGPTPFFPIFLTWVIYRIGTAYLWGKFLIDHKMHTTIPTPHYNDDLLHIQILFKYITSLTTILSFALSFVN